MRLQYVEREARADQRNNVTTLLDKKCPGKQRDVLWQQINCVYVQHQMCVECRV